MKFIHTADWHLGKLLKERALTEDQAWILRNQFLPLVDEVKPHVILLAGDVYDRSFPPEEAVELFDEITHEIVGKRHIPFVIISGNHDSAERLSVASRLLRENGLYIYGPLDKVSPLLLPDPDGEVAVFPLPYCDPVTVRIMINRLGLKEESVHTYEEGESVLIRRMCSLLPPEKRGVRKIAVAHVFAAGGTSSESERPLSVGGHDRISDAVFSPFHYTALGHLHRPQKTQAHSEKIQYSGSLMRYSFDETDQKKGLIVGDLSADGTVYTEFRPLVPLRQVRTLSDTFVRIMNDADLCEDYVHITLTDPYPVTDAMLKLRQKYPNILGVEQNWGFKEDDGERDIEIETMSDTDIFTRFVARFRETELTEEEQRVTEDIWRAVYEKESAR